MAEIPSTPSTVQVRRQHRAAAAVTLSLDGEETQELGFEAGNGYIDSRQR